MPANYVLISEQTVNVPVASVTFSNIPQTGYTDLKVVMSVRTNRADNSDGILCKPNNSASNGTQILVAGSGSGSPISQSFSFIVAGTATAANDTANTFGNAEMYISNYNLTSTPKPMSVQGVNENNASTAFAVFRTNLWSDNSAITSLVFSPQVGTNFIANSTFSLYGIAALGTTPTVLPKASGGDIVVNDGTYWYHAFLSSGVFTPLSNLTSDVLVVAGAGGGGVSYGGGGGGGGFQEFTSQALIATPYPCTVGAGGVGGSGATNGNNSQFGALTASVGGGFGGKNPPVNGNSGGSGGGGRGDNSAPGVGTGGAPTSGQGFAGGDGAITKSAGGGGAGSAGANGAAGGSNGWGKTSVITGGATTGLGVLFSGSYYLAAGGVGVGTITPTVANGGVAAYVVPPANSGTGSSEGTNAASGVVVIRYTMA
jgi:hypothetical protein